MLNITDLKVGTKIEYRDEPYEVIKSQHSKIGRGGAVVRTKLKNILNGNALEENFKDGDKFGEPALDSKKCLYLYQEGEQYSFMDNETYDQFSLAKNVVGEKGKYLIEDTEVNILYYNEQPVNIELPIKIDLKVVKAPPSVKGNTADGGTKEVELETGLKVNTPLFVKEGDTIRVDTRDGKYAERV
ncbi:MAG: elongation factor P [Parcubacteria group bacterium]|nr:elongation factor P [Parcubacteria group bacterium]